MISRFNSFQKMTLTFSLVLAVFLFGTFHRLHRNLRDLISQRIRKEQLAQTALSRSLLETLTSEDMDVDRADRIADRIGQDLGLRSTIIAVDGTVLGDSQLTPDAIRTVENHLYRSEIQQALQKGVGESRRFSTTIKQHMLYTAMPFGRDQVRGIIRLAAPLADIAKVEEQLRQILAGTLWGALVFAVIISLVSSLRISRPIVAMAKAARGIASGDFSKKILVTSRDEIGDLGRAINTMNDQVKQRIEEALSSKMRLEAVLQSMSEGVMVVDEQGRILLINPALQKLFEVTQDLHDRKPIEVVRSVEVQDLVDSTLRLLNGVETKEIRVISPEERTLWVHATPVKRAGRCEGAVLVFHDITELRRLESIRRDFVANVSHELRTPVASIKGYAETLLEGGLQDKKNAKDFVQIIFEDAERLARLVEDILDLSKIESGHLKLEFWSCNLEPIVDRILFAVKKKAQECSVTIDKDIPADLPKIRADELSIAQVLMNLVENAIKYNRPNGSVLVSARAEGTLVRIAVTDTGLGIPESDLPRIFERFYRVDKAHSRDLGGTGLGLSIVKHLVQEHRGEVSVQSVLGQGSSFSFTIPQA